MIKKQFSQEKIKRGEITEEQAVRLLLGNYGLHVDEYAEGPLQFFGALGASTRKLQENPISLHLNSLVYAALNWDDSDFDWQSGYFAAGLAKVEPEGAAILAYFMFLNNEDPEKIWQNSVTDEDNFKGIPVLAEIVEWVLIESDVNGHLPAEYINTLKQGKSLNPDGFSGDETISKDALTAIILVGNSRLTEDMLEAGLWSIKRQALREIVCTIFAYSREIFPENLQSTAKRIFQELNPEFIEYVEFVESGSKIENI